MKRVRTAPQMRSMSCRAWAASARLKSTVTGLSKAALTSSFVSAEYRARW